MHARAVIQAAACVTVAIALNACAPNLSQTTRLTVGDMRSVVDQTVQALAASDFLAERTPESPPIVIAVRQVENNSSDVITRAEQWYMMQAVANGVFDRGLRNRANVTIVIPVERLRDAQRRGTISARAGQDRNPTHIMVARIDSATRSDGTLRQDLYQTEYTIVDIDSGEQVFSDVIDFQRAALGRSYN